MLFVSKLKHEIGREAFLIAFHLLVKSLDRHSVKFGDVGIKDHSLRAKKQDAGFHGKAGITQRFGILSRVALILFFI